MTWSKAKRDAPMLHIGSSIDKPNATALIEALSSALKLAIVTGQEEAAITIADRLGSMGECNTTITGCNFQG